MFVTGLFKGINLLACSPIRYWGSALNWWLVRCDLKPVRGRRIVPWPNFRRHVVRVCDPVATANRTRIRGIAIEDRGHDCMRRWIVLRLSSGEPLRFCYSEAFARRGRQRVKPLRAWSRFPFGLAGGKIDLTPPEERIVLPKLGRLNVERLKHWLAKTARGDGRCDCAGPTPLCKKRTFTACAISVPAIAALDPLALDCPSQSGPGCASSKTTQRRN